jgi:hypothetical protein
LQQVCWNRSQHEVKHPPMILILSTKKSTFIENYQVELSSCDPVQKEFNVTRRLPSYLFGRSRDPNAHCSVRVVR